MEFKTNKYGKAALELPKGTYSMSADLDDGCGLIAQFELTADEEHRIEFIFSRKHCPAARAAAITFGCPGALAPALAMPKGDRDETGVFHNRPRNTEAVNDDATITVNFRNLCPSAMSYAVVAIDEEPTSADAKTIDAGASTAVTKAKTDKIVRRNDDGTWGGWASTHVDGAHVWISSACNGMGAADDPKANPAKIDAGSRAAGGLSNARRP